MSLSLLPSEILDHIAFFIETRRDLLSLALTCRDLRTITVPRHSEFRYVRTPLCSSIWRSIVGRHDLANNVSHLHVQDLVEFSSTPSDPRWSSIVIPTNHSKENEAVTVPLICEALSLMGNLVSLTWMPRLLCHEKEPMIWSAVQQCTTIRHLTVNYPLPWYASLYAPTNPLWSIANLTSLVLENVSTPVSVGQTDCIKSLFRASVGLESLSINNRGIVGVLPDMPLPRLRRLIYRTCTRDYQLLSLRPCPCITTFLESHPTLEDVEWFDAFPGLLEDNSLPALTRLYGTDLTNGIANILNTPTFEKRRIESIGQLRLLPQVFLPLSRIHPEALRRIDISHFPTIEDIAVLADLFPNLTWLRVPSVDYRHDFAEVTTKPILMAEWPDLISRFQHLEVFHGISFFMDPIDCEENHQRTAYLRDCCPKLMELDHWDPDTQSILRISTDSRRALSASDAAEAPMGPRFILREVAIGNLEDRYAWREAFSR